MAMEYSLSKFAAARFVEYVHWRHEGVVFVGIQPGTVDWYVVPMEMIRRVRWRV